MESSPPDWLPLSDPPNADVPVVAPIPAPGGPISRANVEAAIAEWVNHPALARLVRMFGGPTGPWGDLRAQVTDLAEFSVVWDFRGLQERNLAAVAVFDPEFDRDIHRTAETLGLRSITDPRGGRYDHCLILGGLVRACILRPAWAAELARRGVILSDITALGGFRALGGDEPALAAHGGLVGVSDEFDAMNAGMRRAFELGEPLEEVREIVDEQPNSSWAMTRYEIGSRPLRVIAAPSSEPARRRANSADTYEWWASHISRVGPASRLLFVTSAIYVPYQHAAAVRILGLGYGCSIETVGVPPTVSGPLPPQTFTAAHYLQELRSTLREFVVLLAAVDSA